MKGLRDHDKMLYRMTKGQDFKRRRGKRKGDSILGDLKKLRKEIEDHLDGKTKSGSKCEDRRKPKPKAISRNKFIKQLRDIAFMRNVRKRKEQKNKRVNCQGEAVVEDEKEKGMNKGEKYYGGLCGGGQDESPIKPSQTRSYANVLSTGLQGGGKDGKTNRTTNPCLESSPFLRLENPWNTNACFVNSVLQLLQKLNLTEQLTEDPQRPLSSALTKLYKKKEEGQARNIRSLVARISKKKHFAINEKTGEGTQEDASSFLESLEDIIASELAITGHRGELTFSRSFKNQPEGKCPRCLTTPRPRTESFLQLAVPIPASGLNHSLGSILTKYFATNTESEDMKCSNCCPHDGTGRKCTCRKVPSDEKADLTKSPTTLFIQLKRWDQRGSKIMTPVAMEDEVIVDGKKYALLGAIVHRGSTVNVGHYVTYLKHGEGWFLHDDDKQAQKVALNSENGETYVLIAKKCEPEAQADVTPSTNSKAIQVINLLQFLQTNTSMDCELCIKSTQHHCQICKESVCNFHSEAFEDNELHRVHPQCQTNASNASRAQDESGNQGWTTPASKRLKQDTHMRIAELKELKSKRTENENEELISLLLVEADELKQKGKSKNEEEKKRLKSLSDQISRLKKGKEHYAAERVRLATIRMNRTPEKRQLDNASERVRDATRRINRTPEKRQLDLASERVRDATRRINRTPEKRQQDLASERVRLATIRQERTLMKNFREETKFGPHFVCIACHRKLFRTSVVCVEEKMEKLLSNKKQFLPSERVKTKINGNKEFICKTCLGYIRKNKMPKMAVANNLSLNPIPKDQMLTIIEGCCIAKLIIFQMIRLTPKSRWRRLQDRLISVPVMEDDVINTISQLPRTPEEAGLVAVTFKRKLEYKTSHIKETLINPHKIYKVLSELVKKRNPYYQEFQEYQEFKERCIREDED